MLDCQGGFTRELEIETHEEIGLIAVGFECQCLTHGIHGRIRVPLGNIRASQGDVSP